ncbi:MAG: PKD domain-containing protein [Bacteroidota bacterium]
MALYISSDVNTTGQVELAGMIIPFTVTANQATTIQISPTTYNVLNSQSDGINVGKAIHVISVKPIVVYAHILNAARSGSTLVLPTNVLGKEYIALSYKQSVNAQNTAKSQITVVGVEDNTLVEIKPIAASVNNTKPANVAFTVTLNKGDVYQYQSFTDLTGSTIKSISASGSGCKPVSVYSGSTWTSFDCTGASGGDNLYQQLFPITSWGKNFLTAPFANRLYDIFRIIVKDPATKVTLNGSLLSSATLINNQYYEFKNSIANQIVADLPIQVIEYMTSQTCDTRNPANCSNCPYPGDPEIVTLNPLEQTISNVTVVSARNNLTPPNTNIIVHYLNIIMRTASQGSLKIDNAAPLGTWVPIGTSGYSYLQENVTASTLTNPSHNIKADEGFIAVAYGMGNVESYGYNAGTNIRDFTPVATFQNAYNRIDSAVTCSNEPIQFSVPLSFQPTTLKWDFSGAPNMSPNSSIGPVTSPSPDSLVTKNGQTLNYFSTQTSYTFTRSNTAALRDTIKLYTTSATPDGCGSTDQVYAFPVTVYDPPKADFLITQLGCVTDSAVLTDQSSGSNSTLVRWIWNFGDGTTSDINTSSIAPKLYSSAGTGSYDIKLKVISEIGCVSNEVVKTVKLSTKPIAAFTVPAITCVNSNISFTDASTIQTGTIAKWTWDLDNGSGAVTNTTNAAQVQSYSSFGVKDVKMVVESSTGCKSDTFRISPQFKVNALPEPGFVIPEVCLNDASAQFTDTTRIADGSTNFVYLWNFNAATPPFTPAPTVPGAATNSKNPAVKYNDKGNYKVSLTVSSNGCAASLTKDFTVNGANPDPLFEVQQPAKLCANDSVRIKNLSTVDFGNVTRLEIFWDANDLTQKTTDENPFIGKLYSFRYPDFPSPATKLYSITLRAYSGNAASCSKPITQTITVNASPKVNFSTIPGICNEALARQITQATYDNRVAGSFAYTGTGVSATGLYTPQSVVSGTYPVKFTYTSTIGCVDSLTKNITVWPSPVAKWGVSSPLCEKNDLLFSDSSVANFSNISQRIWNYDDGTATVTRTNGADYKRQFSVAKTYNVSLQVMTDSGCKSTVNVQPLKVNFLPKPAFSLPSICLPDGKGAFTSQSSIDDGSESLFSYLWNFNDPNDPSASTFKDPVHRFMALGPYAIKLKITSKEGCIDSLTQSLTTIYPQPKADFTATPVAVCIGDSIRFKDMGDGKTSNPVSWVWNLANGSNSTLQNPVKKFTDSGTFAISYYFFNGQGCVSDTASRQVVVYPYPILVLGPTIKVLEGGQTTVKPKFVYGGGLSYQWLPATYLSSDTAAKPVCIPVDDITYKLILTGDGGCSVSDTIFIQVLRSPEVPNAFSPNGDGINDTWRIKYLESYPGAVIEVFNRYGQLVFHSVGYDKDWDGNYKGQPLPIGTYYYVINPKNNRAIITGSVTIIK